MNKTLVFIAVFGLMAVTANVASAQTGYGGGGASRGGSVVYCTATRTTFCQPAPGQVLGAAISPSQPAGQVLGVAPFVFTQMALGSRGPQVVELQNKLRAEGYFSASSTGYFGPATQAAVRAYQTARLIPSTGYVGPLTLASLNASGAVLGASTSAEAEATLRLRSELAAKIAELIARLQAQLNATQ
jgi:peptidoglycan hydrolase-like protein with peptidoglycan-binding domain